MDLVGYFLMEVYSLSICKGKLVSDFRIGWGTRSVYTEVIVPGGVHTHVGMDIIVCFGGW